MLHRRRGVVSSEVFLALVMYAFVTSVTPGPNNFMLLASGVNFGFRRTVPHMLGIGLGFLVLLLAIGFGLGALMTAFPVLHTVLKVAGGAYLLYLAWRIAMSRTLGKGEAKARPMTFLEAAAFQWVNPKAWMIAIGGMALYTDPARPVVSVLAVAVAFAAVNLPCVSSWAAFGMALRGFLSDPVRLKWFNIAMGVLLALTLWPMLR
jgi:threonine/homoserine/homoserine lactone efflux protein